MTIFGIGCKIKIAPAIALTAPRKTATAYMIATNPVVGFHLVVRMIFIIYKEMTVGFIAKSTHLNVLFLTHLFSDHVAVGKIPRCIGGRWVITQAGYVIAQGSPLIGTFATVPVGYTVTYSATQAILSQTGTTGPYNAWIDAFNVPPLNAADKLPTADPDKDGIINLLEFVLGGNPVVSSSTVLPSITLDGSDVVLTFKRSDASELNNISLSVEVSADLNDWTAIPPIPIGPSSSGAVTITEHGVFDDDVTVIIPLSAGDFEFFRLKAVSPGP